MTHIRITIELESPWQENLIAELLELDFVGFEQFDERLVAYIPKSGFNDVNREYIEELLSACPGNNFIELEEIQEQNWNETWEKTVKPQEIGPFLVRPTWSDRQPAPGQLLLEIDPKMSFGTGYHATTRLMLRTLPALDVKGKTVLDAGTGTGILAIASIKLGAASAFAFDIDKWSETNARENILINQVGEKVEVRLGSIKTLSKNRKFDLALANINRNEILKMFKPLSQHLNRGGDLCLSGLLKGDREGVLQFNNRLQDPMKLVAEQTLDEWLWLRFNKV
ncbi:MAG: 50S ribosomal protein L11 methyltransferase [Balneolaceae bacterium]